MVKELKVKIAIKSYCGGACYLTKKFLKAMEQADPL